MTNHLHLPLFVLAAALIAGSSQSASAANSLSFTHTDEYSKGPITFFVKPSANKWTQATRFRVSYGRSMRLRMSGKGPYDIVVRTAEGMLYKVEVVTKWDATKQQYVEIGKSRIDIQSILGTRSRATQHYDVRFTVMGEGDSPTSFTRVKKDERQVAAIKVSSRRAELSFPAMYGR